MLVKTLSGLEEVLAGELVALGANEVQIQRRAVSFVGDKRLLYKANLCLRTALRILKPIAVFEARNTDELYGKVKAIAWDEYLSPDASFVIDSTVLSDRFSNSQFVTYRVKDGVVDYFREHYHRRPNAAVDQPDLYLNVHIAQNSKVTLSLDSSGESLHKRGWRSKTTAAPLNEVLAAGMLLLAGWDGQCDFVDPMCGSGTLLIEAAMIALNIPPGIYRSHFAFEKWKDFDAALFETLYNDDSEERPFEHHIYGSDSSFYAIQAATQNVQSAGLQKYIHLHQCGIENLTAPASDCLLVTNPPYGERLQPEEILPLYAHLGSLFKHQFAGSEAWVISSNTEALKQIGLRPSRRIHLMNSELDCLFNQYKLFKGDNKSYKTNLANGQ